MQFQTFLTSSTQYFVQFRLIKQLWMLGFDRLLHTNVKEPIYNHSCIRLRIHTNLIATSSLFDIFVPAKYN